MGLSVKTQVLDALREFQLFMNVHWEIGPSALDTESTEEYMRRTTEAYEALFHARLCGRNLIVHLDRGLDTLRALGDSLHEQNAPR